MHQLQLISPVFPNIKVQLHIFNRKECQNYINFVESLIRSVLKQFRQFDNSEKGCNDCNKK